MPTPEWFEEQVLRGLLLFTQRKDNADGATCDQLVPDWVDFWPLYPLQRLYRMGQVEAVMNGKTLHAQTVANLRSADTVVWQLTKTGETRALAIPDRW